jgi:hypothetical protein
MEPNHLVTGNGDVKTIIGSSYSYVSGGLLLVQDDNRKYSFYDPKSDSIRFGGYDRATHFASAFGLDYVACVQTKNKAYVIDRSGRIITEFETTETVSSIGSGVYRFRKDEDQGDTLYSSHSGCFLTNVDEWIDFRSGFSIMHFVDEPSNKWSYYNYELSCTNVFNGLEVDRYHSYSLGRDNIVLSVAGAKKILMTSTSSDWLELSHEISPTEINATEILGEISGGVLRMTKSGSILHLYSNFKFLNDFYYYRASASGYDVYRNEALRMVCVSSLPFSPIRAFGDIAVCRASSGYFSLYSLSTSAELLSDIKSIGLCSEGYMVFEVLN